VNTPVRSIIIQVAESNVSAVWDEIHRVDN
jgi:hypothetical protein